MKKYNIEGYEFYEGTINDIKVVISKTLIGTIISNNEILLEKLDETKAIELQIILIDILNNLIT